MAVKGAAYTASAKSRNATSRPTSFAAAGDKLSQRVGIKREAVPMMETKARASSRNRSSARSGNEQPSDQYRPTSYLLAIAG